MLPTSLLINFTIQRFTVPFPALIEALILMFTFEILYEADALKPSSRGTSLSILGALVLGDAAVNAGIISPIMVIVVAITAISSMFFSYHDFQSFVRTYRYTLMIFASFLGMIGILFGFILILTNLCNIKSFGKPFLIPFTPIIKKSKEEIYLQMLKDYGQSEIVCVLSEVNPIGYFKYYEKIGKRIISNKEFTLYKIFKGSSEFNSKEMSIFIDGIIQECKNVGIETMTPEQVALLDLI